MEKIKEIEDNIIDLPEMSGENLVMTYSDSALIKYKVNTPLYFKIQKNNTKYDEFPKGIHVTSYDQEGAVSGNIKAKYAIKKEDENIWEARNEVVVTNVDGTTLETELLYWDMENKRIYSPQYSRLTMKDNIIEGNNGFESDQDLREPVFGNITGKVNYDVE